MAQNAIYELLRALATKGGPAAGKPYMEPGKPTYPTMNLSPEQAVAPHTLAAALAARGPKGESSLKRHLTGGQQQRLSLRRQNLQRLGYDPNTSLYGPHANLEARHALEGGTGLGRGLGLAQADEAPERYAARDEAPEIALGSLLAQVGRRDRRARRRGYNVS